METLGKILLWIGGSILAIVIGGFLILCFVALGYNIHASATHRYWIDTPDNTYYTNSYTEKDGCITFTDHFNHNVKNCSIYTISDKGGK